MAKNPVSNVEFEFSRLEGLLDGRAARATYCLDQLQYYSNPERRQFFIDLAKLELELLQRVLAKL